MFNYTRLLYTNVNFIKVFLPELLSFYWLFLISVIVYIIRAILSHYIFNSIKIPYRCYP